MLTNNEISFRIKSTRDLRGLTLDDIASQVGVAKSTISRYENGTIAKFKLPVLESIAKSLGVDPNWLIGNTDTPSPVPAPALTGAEQHLLDNFRDLNPDGQDKLIDYSDDLVLSGRYCKTPSRSTSSAAPDKQLSGD